MARALYFDCFAGAAGDMVVGALLDAGADFEALRATLATLPLEGYRLSAERTVRAGITATKFRVQIDPGHDSGHDRRWHGRPHPDHGRPAGKHAEYDRDSHAPRPAQHHRSVADIDRIIAASGLSGAAKARTRRLFERLARVEAAIHGQPVESVHLHEVGAIDSIIDIAGAVVAVEMLGIDRGFASRLNVGGGTVESAHGLLPVPAPATIELLRGAPIYSTGLDAELVTPTGALLISEFAGAYGPVPPMRVDQVGYGAGDRDLGNVPNVLRVLIGHLDAAAGDGETVTVIECEIDDMNPQLYAHLMERVYAAGAVEVFYTSIHMKKNRPGTLVTAVCPAARRAAVTDVLFTESTTIGLRFHDAARDKLDRRIVLVRTAAGDIRLKVASRAGRVFNYAAEYDDCARIAAERGLALKEVQQIAVKAYLDGQIVEQTGAGLQPPGSTTTGE